MNTLQAGTLLIPERPIGGLGFWYEEQTDWYKISDSKSEIRERPQAHGANPVDQDWRESLALTWKCHFAGQSRADVLNARREVHRALAVNVPVDFTLTDDLGPTTRSVSVRSVPMPDEHGQPVFDFTINAIADDPRRYGPAQVVSTGLGSSGGGVAWPMVWPADWGTPGASNRLTITNSGDEETSSVFSVTGGLAAGFEFNHVEDGYLIRFERVVPDGGTVHIDMETGAAWLDNPANDMSGFLTRREFWSVPGGTSHQVAFRSLGAFTGTPILSASTRPAY
jgi:hypothetical protein